MSRRTKEALGNLTAGLSNPQTITQNSGLSLGYATGLNKENAQGVFSSADFLQDVSDYYYNRDGKVFSSTSEMQDYFMSDRRWRNMNTLSIGKDLYDANTQSDEQSARLARLQTVFDALPNFYEEGGDGWKGLGENALAAVADPINLIGFGSGGAAAKAAAAAAIRTGATRKGATRAGLKAGAKKGAIAEGIASGVVEGIADQGIQRRNVEIGIQDDVSYTQTAGAMAAGAVVGGALGSVFGVAGAINPLRPGMKSNIAEGTLDGIAARRADNAVLRGEKTEPAKLHTDAGKKQTTEQMTKRLDSMEAERTSRNQAANSEAELDTETATASNDVAVGRAAVSRMNELNEAAKANEKNAQELAGKGDDKGAAEATKEAVAQRQLSNDIERQLNTILDPKETPADAIPTLAAMNNQGRLLLGYQPEGVKAEGEGFTMDTTPTAEADAQRQFDAVNIPVKREGEGFSGRNNLEVEPQPDETVTAQIAVREAEEALEVAQKELKPAAQRKATAQEAVDDLEAKREAADRGDDGAVAPAPEAIAAAKTELDEATAQVAELESNVTAAQETKSQAEAARREVMTARSLSEEEAAQVEATEAGADVRVENGEVAETATDDYTIDNMVATTEMNNTSIVALLKELGEDPSIVLKDLKSLGDGRSKQTKEKKAAYLRGKLTRIYAKNQTLSLIDLVNASEDGNMFHIAGMRAMIKDAGETPEITQIMEETYMEYVGNRATRLLVESINEASDLSEAIEKIRSKYGDELAGLITSRLDNDNLNMLEDPNSIRALFNLLPKDKQRKINQFEEAFIKAEMEKTGIDENTLRALVYERTEITLEKDALGTRKVKRSEAVLNQRIRIAQDAVKELRGLRATINKLNGEVPQRQRPKLASREFATAKKGAIIEYYFEGGQKDLSPAQTELLDAYKRKDLILEGISMKGQPIGEAIEKLNEGINRMENMRGQTFTMLVNDSTTMNAYDVADEFASAAPHMGTQRRQGLGTYTSYGKEVKGGDVIKKAQGFMRNSRRKGAYFDRFLIDKGVKVGADGRLQHLSGSLNALDQMLDASIANKSNRNVVDETKVKRNQATLARIDEILDEAKEIDKEIRKIERQIEKDPGAANVPDLEDVVADMNRKRSQALSAGNEFVNDVLLKEKEGDMVKALRAEKSNLTRSTETEAAGNAAEEKRLDKAGTIIKGEIIALRKRLAQIAKRETTDADGSVVSKEESDAISARIIELQAELDKAVVSDRRINKVTMAEYKKNVRSEKVAEAVLRGDEPPKQDFAGDVPPEVVDQGVAIAQETQRGVSAEQTFSRKFAELNQRVNAGEEDPEQLLGAIQELTAELQQRIKATQAPNNKPAGKRYTPRVVVLDGIEVDVHNDFKYVKQGDGRTAVQFNGETAAYIKQFGDEEIFLSIAGGDGSGRMYSNKVALMNDLPRMLRERITAHQESTGEFDVRPKEEGMSYPEPDWHNTETYADAPAEAVSPNTPEPIDQPRVASDPNDPMTFTRDDFDVPPARDIAVQITDPEAGAMFGQVRVFSLKKNQTVGDVLKNSSKYQHVVGSVRAGARSNSFASQETFVPLDPEAMFKPHYSDTLIKGGDFDPRLRRSSPNTRENKPKDIDKTVDVKIDQETLSFTPHDGRTITNGFDLISYATKLDTLNFDDLKTSADFETYFILRQRVATDIVRHFPNGVKMKTASMREAMDNLTLIMDRISPEETQAVTDFVMRMARANGNEAPVFDTTLQGYPSKYTPYQGADPKDIAHNNVTLNAKREGATDYVPMTFTALHEMGHWMYFNMLSETDKLEFWGSMQKYYSEEGIVPEMLKKRADFSDGGITNSLQSPQEFFANQFVLWASNSGMVPNLSLWGKITRMAAKLLDLITGKNQIEMDEDLIPIFQRAIPPLGVDPLTGVSNNGLSPFAHLADYGKKMGKEGGNKAYMMGKYMNDLDVIRSQLQTALATSNFAASDATTLGDTLNSAGRRIYGLIGGERHATHHPDYNKTKTVIEADGTERFVTQGNAKSTMMMNMRAYEPLMQAQFRIKEYLDLLREEGALRQTKDGMTGTLDIGDDAAAKIDAMIDGHYEQLDRGHGQYDQEMMALMNMRRPVYGDLGEKAVTHLHRLAQDMMLALDEAIEEFATMYPKQIPRENRAYITIEVKDGVNKGRMYLTQNKKSRHYQKKAMEAEGKRLEDEHNITGLVRAYNEAWSKVYDVKADPTVTDATKTVDSDALAREAAELPVDNKRRIDIANEMQSRLNTKPTTKAELGEAISDAERAIMDAMSDEESTRAIMTKMLALQDNPETAEMAARMMRKAAERLHDMGVENPLPPTNPKTVENVKKMVDRQAGTADDVGISADAPEGIKVAARQITVRTGRGQEIARQAFERLMMHLGYDDVNQYAANALIGRSPERFGADEDLIIPHNDDLFVSIIKRMRQISKAAEAEDDTQAYNLVGETLFHALSPSEVASVSKFAEMNDEEPMAFFVDTLVNQMKTNKQRDLSKMGADARKFHRIIKREGENVHFVLNGLVKHDKTELMLIGGDIFAMERVNTPHVTAADAVNRNAVSRTVAPKYATEVVANMSSRQEHAAREFLGVSPQTELRDHVKFNSAEGGSVVIDDGAYGTGIYLKRGDQIDQNYSTEVFVGEMDRQFVEFGLTGERLTAARDAVKMIAGLRQRIKAASAAGKPKLFIRDLLYMEDMQYKILSDIAPGVRDNKVQPVFARIENSFDFTSNNKYSLVNEQANDISHVIADMAEASMIDPEGARRIAEILPAEFTGRELFTALTDARIGVLHKHGNSATEADAKDKLLAFLGDYGYDAIETDEGTVIWNEANVRHVKHGFTESEVGNFKPEQLGGDLKVGGLMAEEMFYRNGAVDKGFAPGVAKDLEKSGAPSSMVQAAVKMVKGHSLNKEDVDKASIFSSVRNFFTENSRYFRVQGAKWFGNMLKPVNGTGIFEQHDVELNRILQPIFNELNSLPGNNSGFGRWARKNVEFINQIGQPASHKRIIMALRQGRAAVERLQPQERAAALKIAKAFENELNKLRASGMPVGDARRYGNDFYIPQVWDSEAMTANPNKFKRLLTDFFVKEQRQPGFEGDVKTPDQIAQLVERVYGRMTQEGGVLDTTDVLAKSLSDPMSTRMLRLQSGDYPQLAEFMVNDLQGLLARYFDRTVRKRALSSRFGLQGHGFDTYTAVIRGGVDKAQEILRSPQIMTIRGDTLRGKADIENTIIPKLKITREQSLTILRQVQKALEKGDKQLAHSTLMNAAPIEVRNNPQYRVRVDAIVNAMNDFPQGGASRALVDKMGEMNNVLNKRPLDGSDGSQFKYKFVRNLKAFNSVSLLGFTTLTSIPDLALPLIRSGNMRAFATAWGKAMTDPAYRASAKNIGVGIENLLHDRMVQMGGEGSQKFTNAFFNFTLLTPWTNFNREMASLVGFEAMRAEIGRAVSMRMAGRQDSRGYKKAVRFLERYGLTGPEADHDFLAPGSYRIDDLPNDEIVQNQVRAALLRFTNEAIFTPNPNDVPMWAQTPWGSLIFQLKSFPLMMSRLSVDVVKEASKGNVMPLTYLLTAGAGLGMVSVGVKDLVQSRGGEDQRSSAFRERLYSKTPLQGIIPVEEGGNADERLGWYVEGLMAMGGLGLFAEMLYNSAAQLDNGKYGYVRTMSYAFGPAVGTSEAVFDVAAGVGDAMLGDAEKNGKERQAARQVASRIPIAGGVSAFREAAADLFGEAGGGKKKGFGQSNFGGSNFGKGKFGE